MGELQQPQSLLVAGGAGFLGSHLCERLIRRGYPVVCVDNFVTGELLNVVHLTENAAVMLRRRVLAQQRSAARTGTRAAAVEGKRKPPGKVAGEAGGRTQVVLEASRVRH